MRRVLMLVFSAILLSMLAITTWATMQRGLFAAGRELVADRWFLATLADAYFGFATFYCWVWYKERGAVRRCLWLLLIALLGNLAMSLYMLMQLWRLPPHAPWSQLLLRSDDR